MIAAERQKPSKVWQRTATHARICVVRRMQASARMTLSKLVTVVTLSLATPAVAYADGWWEGACNSDGLEGDGGCTNPNNTSGCTCETKSSARHAASVGTTLAMLGFVAYRIGRKRRR
jgi:hypothetical protein